MNIKNLEAFCRLAELEHYGKTADELGIAQPTLSRTIKRLEEELGVVLFRHHGRNIHLTKIGKIYYDNVQRGLDNIAAGTKTVRDLVDPYSGSIDLGFIFTLGPEIIPQLLQQFRSDFHRQNFNFKFWQGNSPRLIENVKNETCDFALCSFLKDEPEIEFTHILDQPLVAIVANSNPLASKKTVSLKELSDFSMILSLDKTYFMEKLFEKHQLPLKISCRVEEDQALAGLVSINIGVAILPFNNLLQFHDVQVLQLEEPQFRSVYLAKKKDALLTSAALEFERFLINKEFQEKLLPGRK